LPFLASARAAGLIEEIAGGEAAERLAVSGRRPETGSISFDPASVEFLTSVPVPADRQEQYLRALGCQVVRSGESDWTVHVPSWRFDLEIPEDLIEEVIRLHGFEHIGTSVPDMEFSPQQTDPTHRRLRAFLAASGFQELISYIFSSPAELERCRAPEATVKLSDPQGQERSVLRTALYPSLLAAARHNRQFPSLALFEVGHVFDGAETERLGLLLSGDWIGGGWKHAARKADAFVLKGQLERLAAELGADLELDNSTLPHLHPGVSASVYWNGEERGFLGQLHPEIAGELGLPPVFLAELELPLAGSPIRYAEPQRQERNERDLALITPVEVSFRQLRELLSAPAGEHLESLTPFDVYEGENIGEGRRSIALRFIFRHRERTLTDAEINEVMTDVISTAREAGYDVRDR
ncbi:MAG TPA: phenylalanine--tRNA ligase subunit beta, partial [Deinococcales bacterium]|nr:phenylalanine--tRNA ligase subunit beta [Deinococcales bacterium]